MSNVVSMFHERNVMKYAINCIVLPIQNVMELAVFDKFTKVKLTSSVWRQKGLSVYTKYSNQLDLFASKQTT